MSLEVKICGLSDEEALEACLVNGARYVGFVFVPTSRHYVEPSTVKPLTGKIPPSVKSVGLFVNPSDDTIKKVLDEAHLDVIQLHGTESPERVDAIKTLTKKPIIKAFGIATAEDLLGLHAYETVADFFLLDAKAPPDGPSGGNGIPFDWTILRNIALKNPWFLAGGLTEGTIAAAVDTTHATKLDVSSGVEDSTGHKSPQKIKAFLDTARGLKSYC